MLKSVSAIVLSLLLVVPLGVAFAAHKPTHNPPGQGKLAAPATMSCDVSADPIVTWSAVEGAASYQVEYTCLDVNSVEIKESVHAITETFTNEVPDECVTILSAHVRATPFPDQKGGPKGEWSVSDACIDVI